MKVHVTQVTAITGKDGREWTKVAFVTPTGDVGTAMYAKGSFETPERNITDEELSQYATTQVEFDQRGRLVSVE